MDPKTDPLEDLLEQIDFPSEPLPEEVFALEAEVLEEEPVSASPPSALKDSVRLYLNEIGSYPLLSLEEEVALAQRIQAGQEAARRLGEVLNLDPARILRVARAAILEERPIPGLPTPSESERAEVEALCKRDRETKRLYLLVRDGEAARGEFVLANLRLVVATVKPLWRKHSEVELLDLIAEGNRGLIRATETFDPKKGFKFSTYATWWIRQAADRYLKSARRPIRLPVHQEETLARLRSAEVRLTQELGRPPSLAELAEAMGSDWTPERVEEIFSYVHEVRSLEEPVLANEDSDSDPLGAFVESNLPRPEEVAEKDLLRRAVEEVLAVLEPREAQVLRYRLGLHGGPPLTLEAVAKKLGVTRERVRQIERQALNRIRLRAKQLGRFKDLLE